ncbi:DUF3710 domain-containing protein [Parafrankia discariae]|uniref:DUF3710 domain-containing protein n=1 Tax=Parafrankia discariae TaxID=365528 RepID=UPI00037245D8|nr:DUF3710 domain-containing protein [Parafrankia discariae]
MDEHRSGHPPRGPAPAAMGHPGPFDVSERAWPGGAGRGAPEILDLGALRVAVPPGVTARIARGARTGPGTDLVLTAPGLTVRVTVFAAPTSGRLWAGVRAELAAGHPEAAVRDGPHGPELLLPGSRVVGADGPRWFLRAVVTPADAAGADDILRGLVVVRGPGAMPAGTALPLLPVGPAGSRPKAGTVADLWTDEPLTAGTGTLEGRRATHEYAAAFTGDLSRNLSTWG